MRRESTEQNHYLLEFIKKAENQNGLHEFVQEHDRNVELIFTINNCIENFIVAEADEFLYESLFHLYQDSNQKCQNFVLQFLPALISNYASLIGEKRAMGGGKLETLLLSIYNKEASSNADSAFAKSYKIPSLSNSSVYHEPASTTSSALTERALSRHEQSDKPVMMKVPTKILNRMTVSTRSDVIATALDVYNRNICIMMEASHVSFCKMVLRLARSGFLHLDCEDGRLLKVLAKSELNTLRHYARIKLSNDAYQQIIIGLYFIMHDGLSEKAIVALENLTVMSRYLLNGALTMTLNALNDSIKRSQEETGGSGVSMNPNESVRRIADVTQRRYAVSSSNSLPRPTPIKDSVDSGCVEGEEDNLLKRDFSGQNNQLNINNVMDVKEIEKSPMSADIDIASKMPSESEDENVNESSTLLGNSTSESKTENSDIVCDHEIASLTVTNGKDADPADIVVNEISFKSVKNRVEPNGVETAL